ncbi:MAG TPA: tetratricopeptide repeat-containing protein, partial [Streptosporangiaceae bacterium]
AICRQLGDARGEAITLANLGLLHGGQRRHAEALGCYEQALAICRRVGDRYEEAEALRGLGCAVAAVQGARAARAYWTAALSIFESLAAPQADAVRSLLADHAD